LSQRSFTARVLLLIAAASLALALVVMLTGGFRVYVFGVPLSTRGTFRPLVAAVSLAAAALLLDAALRRRLSASVGALVRLPVIRRRAAPMMAVAAAGWVLYAGLTLGSRAAGGADSYGYLSQAALWSEGRIRVHQDFVATMPWPRADATFSPLGYRPDPDHPHTLVPTYPPGLPLIMAGFERLFGACGPFFVAPICGALLILLTYALGTRVSGRIAGLAAAIGVAASPTFLMMALANMSDVPAAMFWTAALWFAFRPGGIAAVACGLCAGTAVLIRPNLAPLALLTAVIAALEPADEGRPVAATGRRHALTRLLLVCAGGAPFAAGLAWIFDELYGSPFRTGYGSLSAMYDWSNAATNVRRYPGWLLTTQGPLVFAWVLSPLAAALAGGEARRRIALAAFALAVFGSYLFYEPFEAWWYLRFLLPAFPVIFILSADTFWTAGRALSFTVGRALRARLASFAHHALLSGGAAVALFAGATLAVSMSTHAFEEALASGHAEARLAAIGHYVDRHLPANAVVLSAQHSGLIRYYADRLTLRYDRLHPKWLDPALATLRERGFVPYVVLDTWEMPRFVGRFAGQRSLEALNGPPLATTPAGDAVVYALDPREAPPVPSLIAPVERSRLCELSSRAWAR
jgi:hypothetical protein